MVITPRQARRFLVSHLGLARFEPRRGAAGVCSVLERLNCVQLDPLDPIGTNADLVMIARVKGARRGDVHRALYPGLAFEHFAKERCILPARAFPYYRDRAVETPWWRSSERMKRIDEGLLADVLAEVQATGPVPGRALAARGEATPLDWNGWKGTSSRTKLALEVLWTRCQVVVAGRVGRDKLYDVPSRALPDHASAPAHGDFEAWAIAQRAHAAGLLPRLAGPCWSMLSDARTGPLPDRLVEEGVLDAIAIEGTKRRYLAPAGLLSRPMTEPDDVLRILGPLDPALWDRTLVRDAFGFDYVWEVYKPAPERRWGWYVCPLLHRGELVGRIDASIEGSTLLVTRIFREKDRELDEVALDEALERHALACGCDSVKRGPGARRKKSGSL